MLFWMFAIDVGRLATIFDINCEVVCPIHQSTRQRFDSHLLMTLTDTRQRTTTTTKITTMTTKLTTKITTTTTRKTTTKKIIMMTIWRVPVEYSLPNRHRGTID